MPAKKQISKETLIENAFQIVRSKGMNALNMRTLAKMSNCSTQPIYLSFGGGAEELKAEVTKRIADTFDEFIKN